MREGKVGKRNRPSRRQKVTRQVRLRRTVAVLVLLAATIGVLHFGLPFEGGARRLPPKHYLGSVCLDPGHGGNDMGASNQDLIERDINLSVAQQVRSKLEADGYQVFMTRTDNDSYLTNEDRVSYCNSTNANLLVSIHQNYFTDNTTDYTVALYYNQNSRGLAASLANATAAQLGTANNGISSFDDGELMRARMPAALIEGLFISSDSEYGLITAAGSGRLAGEALGIARGIEDYFRNPDQRPTQDAVLDPGELS